MLICDVKKKTIYISNALDCILYYVTQQDDYMLLNNELISCFRPASSCSVSCDNIIHQKRCFYLLVFPTFCRIRILLFSHALYRTLVVGVGGNTRDNVLI